MRGIKQDGQNFFCNWQLEMELRLKNMLRRDTRKLIPLIFVHGYQTEGGEFIAEKGAKLLGATTCPQLKTINASSNRITSKGAASLCQGSWPSLSKLQIGN